MNKKILWVGRKEPVKSEIDELKKMYGKDVIVERYEEFTNIDDLLQKVSGYDDIVVILPLSIIKKLTENGVYPLYPQCKIVIDGKYDFIVRGVKQRFIKFRRIKDVKIVFDD